MDGIQDQKEKFRDECDGVVEERDGYELNQGSVSGDRGPEQI